MPDYSQLGPVLNSIMGSQDREFAHAEGMQNKSLSAQQSMHKGSLANAMKIAKLQEGTQRYGIDVGKEVSFRGQDIQKFGIEQETLQARWTNALNYLGMAAQLRGPEDYFQQANFYRGAAGSDFPAFLADLMSSQGIGGMVAGAGGLAGFGAQSGSPTAASIQGLAQGLTSGANPGQPTGGAGQGLLGSINQIAQNMHRLAPGALEGLTDTELKLFGSGAEAAGHDLPSLLSVYANSRVSQGSGVAA